MFIFKSNHFITYLLVSSRCIIAHVVLRLGRGCIIKMRLLRVSKSSLNPESSLNTLSSSSLCFMFSGSRVEGLCWRSSSHIDFKLLQYARNGLSPLIAIEYLAEVGICVINFFSLHRFLAVSPKFFLLNQKTRILLLYLVLWNSIASTVLSFNFHSP